MSAGHQVYRGVVSHARFEPVEHRFRYALSMVGLDLDHLQTAFRGRWLWSVDRPNVASIRRKDHLRGGHPVLATAVRDLVERETGDRPAGPVQLVTQPRYLGYCLNPISLYLCHDAAGDLRAIVAEVHNTPWGEQHAYVLSVADPAADRIVVDFDKAFHVSPFMPMDLRYRLQLRRSDERLQLQLDCYRQGRRVFAACLDLVAQAWSAGNLAGLLWRTPLMTLKVAAAIYWEALRLLAKRVPYFKHPSTQPTS